MFAELNAVEASRTLLDAAFNNCLLYGASCLSKYSPMDTHYISKKKKK